MNIVNKLTLRHLRLNRGRTLITILGIVLSVAMVCCVAGFLLSLRDLGLQEVKNRKGDWHVAFIDVTPEAAELIASESNSASFNTITSDSVFASYYTDGGNADGLVNVYLRLDKPGRDILDFAEELADRYGVFDWRINKELLALEGVIPYDNVMKTFIIIAVIAIIVIVVGSIIVIANAFYISASERVRQFGLLKSTGATSGQLMRSILFEALVLTVIALPIGIATGFLIQAAVLWLTNNLLFEIFAINVHNTTLAFRVVFNPLIIYISTAIAVLTVLVSAWLPALRAAKTSPIDAIRQSKDIQIRPKRMKTSRLTQILFGFEGTLAAKSLKRSRGKYRATVISLTVSIILFISISSLVWVMNESVEMMYGGYNLDVLLKTGCDLERMDGIKQTLETIPNNGIHMVQRTCFETLVPDGFFTDKALNSLTDTNMYGILVFPIPDDEFSKIVSQPQGKTDGILINTTGSYTKNGKLHVYTPYNYRVGTQFPLSGRGPDYELHDYGTITIAATIDKIPSHMIAPLFEGNYINVLVSETVYKDLQQIDRTFAYFAILADDPDAFFDTANELLKPHSEYFSIVNVSQATRFNRNITLIFMLFGYGFITMLSLIAVTSVISTISTGMTLRRQEFAMLYSAGMTPEGMNKMLNLESFLYGLKSLIIGTPVGLALSYLIYVAMGATADFAFELPWSAITISAAAVMLLTFGTMRYGKRKLSRVSIVEAIRNEAI